MNTQPANPPADLLDIAADIAAALGEGWRSEPGRYEHVAHLVEDGGLTLRARMDPNKQGRLLIGCESIAAVDVYGGLSWYHREAPSIGVSASRHPYSIASDIRSRLLPDARTYYSEAAEWAAQAQREFAIADDMRRQVASLPDARANFNIDRRKVYGRGWECQIDGSSCTLVFRSASYADTLLLLRTFTQPKEEPMPSPKPAQDHMFPAGDDLPLFSEAPVKVADRPFVPKPHAAQPSLLDLRPTFGGEEPSYQPAQPSREPSQENQP